MGNDRDARPEGEEYQFMKETIKRRPLDTRRICGRVGAIVGGGALFGVCAAAVFTWTQPSFSRYFYGEEPREDIKLMFSGSEETEAAGNQTGTTYAKSTLEATSGDGSAAAVSEGTSPESVAEAVSGDGSAAAVSEGTSPESVAETTSGDGGASESGGSAGGNPLEEYGTVYSQALEISREPRKALVTVSGVSDGADLLDDSILSYGDTEGIIFLDSDSDYYILTAGKEIEDARRLMITFCDSSTAPGVLCKADDSTGLAVVRVSARYISEETLEEISVARLDCTYNPQQAKPVIAIGSPTGERDGVLYGVVTAVTGRFVAADAQYSLMTTDMQGSPDGTGVLLDTDGSVVGIITKKGEGESRIIRALPVAQLWPLLETLCNGEPVKYLGIHGVDITQAQADELGIPVGVYVESVDKDSPAMAAGIQNGDIITELAGNTVEDMQDYASSLQSQEGGSRVKIKVSRRNPEDGYVDMDLNADIEER